LRNKTRIPPPLQTLKSNDEFWGCLNYTPTEQELAAANADFFESKFIRETTFGNKMSYHDKPSPSISLDVMDEAKVDANISPEHGRIIWDRRPQFAAFPQKMEKHSSYLTPPPNLPICNRRQLQL
jgi:hypothetical protein